MRRETVTPRQLQRHGTLADVRMHPPFPSLKSQTSPVKQIFSHNRFMSRGRTRTPDALEAKFNFDQTKKDSLFGDRAAVTKSFPRCF